MGNIVTDSVIDYLERAHTPLSWLLCVIHKHKSQAGPYPKIVRRKREGVETRLVTRHIIQSQSPEMHTRAVVI